MKLMVSLLLLAVICQAYAAKKSTKSKKTTKSDKSEADDNNYGDRTESRGQHSREEDNDSGEDLFYRPHIYSPHHYGKISDVLADGHYHDAIAHQLYSPLSPYQHRFGVPGYEISAPIPSELAYAAHEIHRPISSKKYKKKGQSKHSYHEEDLLKDHLHYQHSYPHLPSYPHEYSGLRSLYPHVPHHLYPERALISPHLYPGVSPLVRPIVPPVLGPLGHHVIPRVGLPHPLAYANGAIPYGHGYVQPVQYIQQHSVEQVIPGVSYGQENQESQRDLNGQATPSGVVGQQPALQQQQYQQQQLQSQQFQQQPISTQPLQPQHYQQLLIQPQQLQSQQVQSQQVQPQQLQNVQLQPEQTQGAVSYASFSQSLPSNYQQNQAYSQPQTQSTQTVTSQLSQSKIYQPELQTQQDSQSLFQSESSTQQSQQDFPRLQSVNNFQTTPSPQTFSTARTIAPGYLPVEDKQELNEEASQSLVQIQTSEPPHLQSYKQSSNIQQTTTRPELTAQSISQSQSTHASSQDNFQPQPVTTSSPQTNQQQSSNDLSNTDKDKILQELSIDQPTVYSHELVIQQPGIPGADIHYFGDYTGSL